MTVIKNSMSDDLKTVESDRVISQDLSGSLDVADQNNNEGIKPETDANLPNEDPDIIEDEYEGNLSYEKLKSQESGTKDGGNDEENKFSAPPFRAEVAEAPSETVESKSPKTNPETDASISREKEVTGIVSDLDRADWRTSMDEERESGDFRKDMLSARNEIISKVGRKRIVYIVLILIVLAVASAYVLKNRNGSGNNKKNNANAVNLFADDSSNIKNVNDSQRVKNLTIVAKVAVIYHLEEKADLPVSTSYIKLDEVNPVTDFLKSALEKYGKPDSLLLDPRDPGFYYTYRSMDGQNVEFDAHIEDTASINCTNQDPCLFRKILTEDDMKMVNLNFDQYKQSL